MGVFVGTGVLVAVGVFVGAGVGVSVGAGVGLRVAVGVFVGTGVLVAVGVFVGAGVGVSVGAGVGVGVGVSTQAARTKVTRRIPIAVSQRIRRTDVIISTPSRIGSESLLLIACVKLGRMPPTRYGSSSPSPFCGWSRLAYRSLWSCPFILRSCTGWPTMGRCCRTDVSVQVATWTSYRWLLSAGGSSQVISTYPCLAPAATVRPVGAPSAFTAGISTGPWWGCFRVLVQTWVSLRLTYLPSS